MPRRARREEGERTTLRVPSRLDEPIRELMADRDISRNEALIVLASLGAETYAAERRSTAARQRLARAVLSPVETGPYPSAAEVEAAMREARGDRD